MNEQKTNERLVHVSVAIQEFFEKLNIKKRKRKPVKKKSKAKTFI